MNRNNWKGLALLLLYIIILTSCDSEETEWTTQLVNGLVTELQVEDNGDLTGIVIRTDEKKEIGILFTEKTTVRPGDIGSWTGDEVWTAFKSELQPDVEITAECARNKMVLTKDSGVQITAYEASHVNITGWRLNRGVLTLRDGTPIDVIENELGFTRTYLLTDGTILLRELAPFGPENSYVGGVESFDDLNGVAQGNVLAYYEQRGLLYDRQEELEKVYALYQKQRNNFFPGYVEQSVSPSASSDRVMYFLTTIHLPTGYENGNNSYEIMLCDAFDRETGGHVDTWDLFAAPKETVMTALLDKSGLAGNHLYAELEAVSWEQRIAFFPDCLSVTFEWGALPNETSYGGLGFSVDYDSIVKDLMQDWAIPKSRN